MPSTTATADTTQPPSDRFAPKARVHPVRWVVVLAVVLTTVLEVVNSTIINLALPHIKAVFGITTTQATRILNSYIVASGIVMQLTGFFVRRLGCRLITTAIVGFAVFSALYGLSWSVIVIAFWRMGQGMFGAFLTLLS